MSSGYLLRPRTAGELLDTALVLVKQYPIAFLSRVGPPYLLGAVLALLGNSAGVPRGYSLLATLAGLIIAALVEAQLLLASLDVLEGRPFGSTPIGPILRQRGGAIVAGYVIKWFTVIAGLLILVLPGAYLLALYFAVPAVSALENLGVRAARARSRTLARGNIGRVLATIGVFDLGVIGLGLAAVLLLPGGTHAPYKAIIGWVIGLIASPIKAALIAALYLDCRIRLEGYDLDRSLSGLPGSLRNHPSS